MMEEILTEQGFQLSGCTSSECAVEAGKLLGVEKMIGGSVNKLGNLYTLFIRKIDVESGEILSTASIDCQCAIEEVAVKSTKDAVKILLGEDIEEEIIIEDKDTPRGFLLFKSMDRSIVKTGIRAGLAFPSIQGKTRGEVSSRQSFCGVTPPQSASRASAPSSQRTLSQRSGFASGRLTGVIDTDGTR